MSAPVDRWKLGLFVVLALAVLLGGLTWLGMARLQRRMHTAYAFFDEPLVGLEPGSSVRFRGVPIGVVAGITLAPDGKHLAVRTSLFDDELAALGPDHGVFDPDGTVRPELRAQVVTSFLTQKSFVLVDFAAPFEARRQVLPFAAPANTIPTVSNTYRDLEAGMRELLRELPLLLQTTRDLMQKTQQQLTEFDLPGLGRRADEVLAEAERTLRNVDQLEVVAQTTASMRSLQALADAWRAPDGPVQTLAKDLSGVAAELRRSIAAADAAGTAEEVRAATRGLGDAGSSVAALAQDLRSELPSLRSALASIERLAALLERDPGALLHGRAQPASPLTGRDR